MVTVAGFDGVWYEWYGGHILIDGEEEPTYSFEDIANQNDVDDGFGLITLRDSAGFTWLWDGELLSRDFPTSERIHTDSIPEVYERLEGEKDRVNDGIITIREALRKFELVLDKVEKDSEYARERKAIAEAFKYL